MSHLEPTHLAKVATDTKVALTLKSTDEDNAKKPVGASNPNANSNEIDGEQYAYGVGGMIFSATSAMIGQILKIIQMLAEISAEFNEIVHQNIQTQSDGAKAAAEASKASMLDQAKQTQQDEFAQIGSAVALGLGAATMIGLNARAYVCNSSLDTDIDGIKNKQSTLQEVNEEEAGPAAIIRDADGEDAAAGADSTRGTTPEEREANAAEEARVKKLAKRINDNNGILEEKEGDEKVTDADYKKALEYIRDHSEGSEAQRASDADPEFSKNKLEEIRDRLEKEIDRLSGEKRSNSEWASGWSQTGQLGSQFVQSTTGGIFAAKKAKSQVDQASNEAAQQYAQFISQASQTGAQQGVSERDAQIQEITTLLSTLQQQAQANSQLQ